ncbi:DUF1963 domain-containing protein [Bacillus sp. FJAT-52991]|uniref:DUF1963 domain-containing protein n=1 Tax=Bacillus kandeliae TaxID=3129297 RepID=A0ABZ2NA51_9BACI
MEARFFVNPCIRKEELKRNGREIRFFGRLPPWGDEETTEQTTHRIDGHSDTIQGDMYLQCQLVTKSLYCGDSTAYNHPLRKELEPHVKDWHLLLQLDSEDDLGYLWGDSGKLYFWIRKEDCKNKKFDKAWTVLQCY